MNEFLTIELEEKISSLQAMVRKILEEKQALASEVALLKKEKEILLNALSNFTTMEETLGNLKDKNVVLEGQLTSLISAIEKMEKEIE